MSGPEGPISATPGRGLIGVHKPALSDFDTINSNSGGSMNLSICVLVSSVSVTTDSV